MDDKVYGNLPAAATAFAQKALQGTWQPRDDEEFLVLSSNFLGETPLGGVKFHSPGMLHHARCMSKALNCLKIYLFQSKFQVTRHRQMDLQRFCLFIVLMYMEHWFLAPSAACAPRSD
jgi:hypothetical protein